MDNGRTMGSKDIYALRLQELLYQQMIENSEFCDVSLLIGDEVNLIIFCEFSNKYVMKC